MWTQHPIRRKLGAAGFLFALLAFVALHSCGSESSQTGASGGLIFLQPRQELGTLTSGEVRELRFPFEVYQRGVTPHAFQTSCGCVNARFVVGGKVIPLHEELPVGEPGELHVEWETSGFLGLKESTVKILGEGPGLPSILSFRGELLPWFDLQPEILDLGTLDGETEQRVTIRVRGPEPFVLKDILAGFPPVEIEGLPSAEPASEQSFDVVLPKGAAEEGEHRGFIQIRSDQPFSLTLPIRYEIAGKLWVQPSRRLLLGEVASNAPQAAILEVGAREGELQKPQVRVEGIEGVEILVVTLEDLKHYQIKVLLPSDLASGPVAGKIHLRLPYRHLGREQSIERVVPFLGVVSTP